MVARAIAVIRIVVTGIGIFAAFYRLFGNPPDVSGALDVVLLMAGLIGLLSFLSHVIFHTADAERLGWQGQRPDFQFEVGFANLAFGVTALCAYFGGWGQTAAAVAVLGYGLYLLQAAFLHLYRFVTGGDHLTSVIFSFLLSGYLIYFAARALSVSHLPPF